MSQNLCCEKPLQSNFTCSHRPSDFRGEDISHGKILHQLPEFHLLRCDVTWERRGDLNEGIDVTVVNIRNLAVVKAKGNVEVFSRTEYVTLYRDILQGKWCTHAKRAVHHRNQLRFVMDAAFTVMRSMTSSSCIRNVRCAAIVATPSSRTVAPFSL